MKFKSVENLTLEECQEYLDANPNGELAPEVVQRLEYLKQLKDRQQEINDFNIEFNRYYATQRYEDAFAICLKYIENIDDKTVVLKKANSVISKLKNRILLPSSVAISYDWLIDQLLLKGYDKMKYDGDSLKWQKSSIFIKQQSKTSEIICKCRVNLFIRILGVPILIFATLFIWAFITLVIGENLLEEEALMPINATICAFLFVLWWLRTYIEMHNEPRLLLRRIANIIIDTLAKQ